MRGKRVAEGECEGLAFPAAVHAQAMERAALRGKARLCGGSAMQSAWLLARLRQRALPAGPALPASAPLLLGPQARDGAGRLGRKRPCVAGRCANCSCPAR